MYIYWYNFYKLSSYIYRKIFILFLPVFVLSLGLFKELYIQIINYDVPSINFIYEFNILSENKSKNIHVNDKTLGKEKAQDAIYLQSINKNITNKNFFNTYDYIGNGNDKLSKEIFYNVKSYYKKK